MLKIASISDIHLGHKRNKTKNIIAALIEAFPDNSETADLDIIFIAGDVFDNLLTLNDENITDIQLWVDKLLRICAKHDIVLRILEGTPSHDWKQSRIFDDIHVVNQVAVDCKYVQTLSIEYIEKFGINVLYVPDEWLPSTDKTFEQVKDLMQARGLDKVDYAIMHGNFEYQLPSFAKNIPKHNSSDYLSIVRELIFIGHHHVFSNYKRIYAQGSFDRLSHGEEGPKGHLRAIIHNNGTHEVKFIENKKSRQYITIQVDNRNTKEFLEYIDTLVDSLPLDSCIRVSGKSDDPIISDMTGLLRMYPYIVWSKLVTDIEVPEEELTANDEVVYTPITISKENVESLLMNRLFKTDLLQNVIENANKHIKDLL